ncbi:helix-turn-helix domain-containing protein [Candidatus Saccharibacteria bacterium]|nr:MAG: helix-turn-helix domain-containing protein [Candidatus Saccharibacteria bacterium]
MSGGTVANEKSLGKQLQQARQRAGLTQQAMCQKAGLSYSTLAKIERGAIKSPSIFTIQQIAEVLAVSLDELVGARAPGAIKKRTKSGVTFVYFDINGCLVRFYHRAFASIAKDTGLSPDAIETAFWHYNDAICTGAMSIADFNQAFAKDLGLPKIDWQSYYLAAVDPISEMHELVKWAAQNYRIGLMSNIGTGFVQDMKATGLLPDVPYDVIIDSSQVGVIKPDPKIYQIAQERAGVPPEEILLIDDTRGNLMPAQRAGWHVMWFNDYDSIESTERVRSALEPREQ